MNLKFPQDRSAGMGVAGTGPALVGITVASTSDLEAPAPVVLVRRLAYAALHVFSRMLQQPALRLPVHGLREDGSLARAGDRCHAAWTLVEEHTLAEAAGAVVWSSHPDADHPEIDALLCIGAPVRDEALRAWDGRMVVAALFHAGDASRIHLEVYFDEAQLARSSAQDLLEKISMVCEALSAAPQLHAHRLELLTPTALRSMPDVQSELIAEPQPLVPGLFREVARRCWSEPAIAGQGGTYTYGALWMQAVSLAGQLRDQGLAPGEIVAIAGVSSFGTIAAMVAALMAGGVVVTLDPALPAERLSRIASICQPRFTIAVLAVQGGMRVQSDREIAVADWPPQGQTPPATDWRDAGMGDAIADDACAYVFFTSGSTGEPKGVLGTHLGLAHFLNWQRSNFPIGPGDRSAQLTALSFDVVLRDIFFPLTSGACLCIPERDALFDARRILGWMSSSNITVMHSVPSLMKAWLQAEQGERPFGAMRYIFFAGEPLTDTLIARFRAAASPDVRVVNLYGPTETTLAKLCNPIERVEPGVQPVGYPQPGVHAFVMRDRSARCGLWEVGEIVIRTPYRSKGYLRQEELTRQAFIPNPWRDDPGDLIYCTGDLGRFRSDGKIEIFGRIDSQIKIRGVRIEPNEIESELARIEFVKDAAISARLNSLDEKFLVAFVVLRDRAAMGDGLAALSQQLRTRLRGALHDAMVPGRFVFVETLPHLPNGKLDRKAIAALETAVADEEASARERLQGVDVVQLPVIAKIESALGRTIDSTDQSFVDLGGDSLSYIRVSLVLEESLGSLPANWEQIRLKTLLGTASTQPRLSAWVNIDVPLLFRAVSILLVVLNHTGVVGLAGTTVLFVISGISFGKFLRPAIFQSGSLKGVFRFVLRYGVPAALWQLLRSVVFHRFWLPDLLLFGTMFQQPGNGHWTLWYLDILTASLLLLSVVAKLEVRRRGAQRAVDAGHRFGIDCGVVLVGVVLAVVQVSTGWWNGEVGVTSTGPFRWLWLLAYGVAVSQGSTARHKAILTALLALPLVSTGLGLPLLGPVFDFLDVLFYVAVLAILWRESITIPRVVKGLVVEVASASLFIYIVNVAVISQILPRLGVPPWWPLQTLAAVVAGVAANRAWDVVLAVSARWTQRWRAKAWREVPGPS